MSVSKKSFSKVSIEGVINSVGTEFQSCLETVLAIETGALKDELGQRIIEFQPKLFDAIAILDDCYRNIKQEEKRLIARKKTLKPTWFKSRMSRLANYRSALREAMNVGRSIGDGFAWFFYERDRELIAEHLQHDLQPLLPPKIGRIGERACLDMLRYVDGHFQLFHGITSFLRMGDFSFVNLSTLRISAIGELKTMQVKDGQYSSSLSIVSKTQDALPNFESLIAKNSTKSEQARQKLLPNMEKRRKRQVKQIGEAIAEDEKVSLKRSIDAKQNEFYFEAIEEVVSDCSSQKMSTKKVSDGLMVCAVRLGKRGKLSDALFSKSSFDVDRHAKELPNEVLKIMVPKSKENSLYVGSIGFAKENLFYSPDRFPFVLWPLKPNIMTDIIFGRVMVLTFFNPLPFKLALEKRGLEVDVTEKLAPKTASITFDNRQIRLENLQYYTRLIQNMGDVPLAL